MEYTVRAARITDIEALVALSGGSLGDGSSGPLGPADLMRQLVFLPHATVIVAERKRDILGGAVLAIRPSVRAGGYVGTIDLLVVDPASEPDAVSASLIEECLRSAANKGCASVEAPQPDDPAEQKRWKRQGFKDDKPILRRIVDPQGAGADAFERAPISGARAREIGDRVGKNVAVFVDVANIFYAAKAAGVDIDYVTLLKASSAGRDLVRAYAYTGLDPDNENQRNFHDFLRRHGYRVVSKDIRKYGDGKVKANLDIELVVDMMKTARNLDVAIVVSGDGDFAPAIRAVQEQGVRVEVVSFRGNTSSDLMDVADLFTDITQIAKVEKGSSRSGRRVATDDEDLSMTEVPDKQSEGSTERNRRGRTRRTPVAATTAYTGSRGRGRAAAAVGEGALVALPGEKLSRAASAPEPEDGDLDEAVAELDGAEAVGAEAGENGRPEDGPRRRRRRGGRGRGRGRGRDEGLEGDADAEDRVAAVSSEAPRDQDEAEAPAPPARRPASSFGSVWDSQIGIAARGSGGAPVVDDDEDLEEPAVPEYLLAERRQRDAGRGGNRGGAGRGRGGAYAAALDRERFGGGRGSTPSRFGEPPPRREGAYGRPGGDRDRDRGDRDRGDRDRGDRDRGDRQQFRQPQRPAPRPSGDEPWSEVPPEIEAMLRAQIGSRPAPARPAAPAPAQEAEEAAPESVAATSGRSGSTRRTSTRGRRSGADTATAAAESGADEAPVIAEARPPARRTRRSAAGGTVAGEAAEAVVAPAPSAAKRTTARRATTTRSRTKASASAANGDAMGDTAAAPSDATELAAPKRQTTRRKAEPAA